MPIQAIFFDLDDTLLDDDRGWRISVAETGREIASRHPAIDGALLASTYAANSERLWRQFGNAPRTAQGLTSTRDLRLAIWSVVLEELGLKQAGLADEILDVYEERRRTNYTCFPETFALLDRLVEAYPLAVITNGPSEGQREKLAVTGLARYFQVVVTSNDIGVGKPAAAIFNRALGELEVAPEQALHTGDNLHADVGGALNAGLTAVWLNRRGVQREASDPEPDHEITSLEQILELL